MLSNTTFITFVSVDCSFPHHLQLWCPVFLKTGSISVLLGSLSDLAQIWHGGQTNGDTSSIEHSMCGFFFLWSPFRNSQKGLIHTRRHFAESNPLELIVLHKLLLYLLLLNVDSVLKVFYTSSAVLWEHIWAGQNVNMLAESLLSLLWTHL